MMFNAFNVILTKYLLHLVPEDEKIARNCCWVEFDDGDSGEFPLQDVRLIPPDFPQEGTGKILLSQSHQTDIRMRSHGLLRLDSNKSAASCQQA